MLAAIVVIPGSEYDLKMYLVAPQGWKHEFDRNRIYHEFVRSVVGEFRLSHPKLVRSAGATCTVAGSATLVRLLLIFVANENTEGCEIDGADALF
jgi:hypothetical protein